MGRGARLSHDAGLPGVGAGHQKRLCRAAPGAVRPSPPPGSAQPSPCQRWSSCCAHRKLRISPLLRAPASALPCQARTLRLGLRWSPGSPSGRCCPLLLLRLCKAALPALAACISSAPSRSSPAPAPPRGRPETGCLGRRMDGGHDGGPCAPAPGVSLGFLSEGRLSSRSNKLSDCSPKCHCGSFSPSASGAPGPSHPLTVVIFSVAIK